MRVLVTGGSGFIGSHLAEHFSTRGMTYPSSSTSPRDAVRTCRDISDVARAWAGALNNPAAYGSIFNLGSGARLSTNQVADHGLAEFGRRRAER